MSATLDKLYDWLALRPEAEADEVFGEALARAEEPYFGRIAAILIERGRPAGFAALLAHYDRLDESIRGGLDPANPALRDGAARAMKSRSSDARLNTMTLLMERPSPRLAYLLPDALRDSSTRVREVAPQVLRQMAGLVADQTPPADVEGRAEYDAGRTSMLRALDECLRTYDLHLRPEVVETALWFARELGAALWEQLETPQSKIARAAEKQIEVWDSPRMTGFLLEALRHAEWRPTAQKLLRQRQGVASLQAVLRHADFLDDPAGGRAISAVRTAGWFEGLKPDGSQLPEDLRHALPRWIVALDLPDALRLKLLSGLWPAGCARTRRQVAYALARLGTSDALDTLAEFAGSAPEIRPFVDWLVAGMGTEAGLERPTLSGTFATRTVVEFDTVWQECRMHSSANGSAWVHLRMNARNWSNEIRAKLREGEARDRLLCLRLFAEAELKPHFEAELRELAQDRVPGIRKLAAALLSPGRVTCVAVSLAAWEIPAELARAIRDAMNPPQSSGEGTLLWYLAGCAALIGIGLLVNRVFFARKAARRAPPPNFLRLAAPWLGLSRADRALLTRLARGAQVQNPLALLLTPANLAAAVARAGESAASRRLANICRRHFGLALHELPKPRSES